MKWKKLSSNRLFDHPRIAIYEDTVELPNGHKTTYIHFGDKMPDAAMIVAVNAKEKILVQKEYSYPPDEILFQLPGGAIDNHEDPKSGAERELAEEAGLSGDLELLGWFYVHNRRSKQKMYIYEARNLKKVAANLDPEEHFEEYWFSAEEINHLINTNEIRNYTLLAGWAIYSNRIKKH